MADALDALMELAIAYDPPGDTRDLFGIDEEMLWRVLGTTLARLAITYPVEVSVLVTDDAGLRDLNREYRDKDEPTDVLSFPLLDRPVVEAPADQLWQAQHPPTRARVLDAHLLSDEEDVPLFDVSQDEEEGGGEYGEDDEDDEDKDEPDEYGEEDANEGSEDHQGAEPLAVPLGDIALSRDAVIRQAAQAGHSPAWECAYLIAHGVLHLVGYDDHTEAGYRAMVGHQEAALATVGLTKR